MSPYYYVYHVHIDHVARSDVYWFVRANPDSLIDPIPACLPCDYLKPSFTTSMAICMLFYDTNDLLHAVNIERSKLYIVVCAISKLLASFWDSQKIILPLLTCFPLLCGTNNILLILKTSFFYQHVLELSDVSQTWLICISWWIVFITAALKYT